jgi:putative FmdB family regulatory protein
VPTYQYVCTDCGGQVEAVQKFTDDPLTMHDECGGKLRKVYSAVGIVFKGSGFYRTDSRSGPGSSASKSPLSSAADSGSSTPAPESGSSPSPATSSSESGKSDQKAGAAPASTSGPAGKASEKVA